MNYLQQIYYEMKHQKMMTWVSISGTALAIFLVMVVVIAESIYTVEVQPETKRSRILYGMGLHLQGKNDSSTMGLSYEAAKDLYEGLDNVETISYVDMTPGANVRVPGGVTSTLADKVTDSNIWKIYDYTFIDGRPYTEAEAESKARVAVLTRSSARKLFKEEKVAGRQIEVNTRPYTVVGVIEDPKPVLTQSFTEILRPFNPATLKDFGDGRWFGNLCVVILAREGADIAGIKNQVKQRYKSLQTIVSKEQNSKVIYHQQPFTSRDMAIGADGSNTDPQTESHDSRNAIILTILILLPAINLSSMTRSRLRHRVTEIGVRRAFGASRSSIIRQILGENFIITLLGGIIGLTLSFAFMALGSQMLFEFGDSASSPDLSMIFSWKIFFSAFVICFVLNLISATVPAWKASKVQPAAAIAGSR